MKPNHHDLGMICFFFISFAVLNWFRELSLLFLIPVSLLFGCVLAGAGLIYYEYLSKNARERTKRMEAVLAIPSALKNENEDSIKIGNEVDLKLPIYLPDSIRSRHVHILGATGSGKTESVILNFLKQDVSRGLGAVILDAKGDASMIEALTDVVGMKRLKIFDLGGKTSLTYNPLSDGSPLEAGQRLFASLVWSEEYYKSKALTAIQKIFQGHYEYQKLNPTVAQISNYLSDLKSYQHVTNGSKDDIKQITQEFNDLAGLRDQIRMLTMGNLKQSLSPELKATINLKEAQTGDVIYFRLQSLMSPQLVGLVGRLIINHLSYIVGSIQRNGETSKRQLVPVYLDEFASFACVEFADLISKARSAGFALHFSHQSVGDLKNVSDAFLSQITDNSATKIILRINDPDSAEFFARTFGTKIYEKFTKRVSNIKDLDLAEIQGEGSSREAHQFRASPDLFKNHPTGVGSVLVSHGYDTQNGASNVFRVRFPRIVQGNHNVTD